MAKPGEGFLGRPKEAGEERERACSICKKTTFHTYCKEGGAAGWGTNHLWKCNACGERNYFD